MHKRDRERVAVIPNSGYEFLRIERRAKHTAFVCAEGTIICATTPSDWRDSRNFRSLVRRLGRR